MAETLYPCPGGWQDSGERYLVGSVEVNSRFPWSYPYRAFFRFIQVCPSNLFTQAAVPRVASKLKEELLRIKKVEKSYDID
jgi:hypothetical protein